ncbi:hypothetical protein CB1_000178005 [Camelus ferus]|nr:hypothetical protein CB1_000178005 [Camelus ferus]
MYKFGAEFRRFSLERSKPGKFEEFYGLLQHVHKIPNVDVLVGYADIHGDLLPINNDDNYHKAVSTANPLLRIFIQKKDVDILPETHRRVRLYKYGTEKPLGFYIRDGSSVRQIEASFEPEDEDSDEDDIIIEDNGVPQQIPKAVPNTESLESLTQIELSFESGQNGFIPSNEAKEVEETIEGLLLRLEEFCSLTDMIRSDTSQILEENIPLLKAKVMEMRGIYAKVDQLEAFVKMVGHHVSFLEAHVLQAERDHGAFSQALRKWLGSSGLPAFRNALSQVRGLQITGGGSRCNEDVHATDAVLRALG